MCSSEYQYSCRLNCHVSLIFSREFPAEYHRHQVNCCKTDESFHCKFTGHQCTSVSLRVSCKQNKNFHHVQSYKRCKDLEFHPRCNTNIVQLRITWDFSQELWLRSIQNSCGVGVASYRPLLVATPASLSGQQGITAAKNSCNSTVIVDSLSVFTCKHSVSYEPLQNFSHVNNKSESKPMWHHTCGTINL